MQTDAKALMVETAARLLATTGLQGFSIGELIKASGAPRGSVYHHFPHGKEEIIAAALKLVDQRMQTGLSAVALNDPAAVIAAFVDIWRQLLVRSDFSAGCGVLAVASASASVELVDTTAKIFDSWRQNLAGQLVRVGMAQARADSLAVLAVASVEGAVVMCRAQRSLEPLESVSALLLEQVDASSPSR